MAAQRTRNTSFAHGRFPTPVKEIPSIITEDMRRLRTCVRCRLTYYEYQNIGAWRCCQHASLWDDDRKLFPCCGQRSTMGCVACDHTENILLPYPGSVTDFEITRGAPAFKMLRGNLKEIKDYYPVAIQQPASDADNKDLSVIYVYRRSLYGTPELDAR